MDTTGLRSAPRIRRNLQLHASVLAVGLLAPLWVVEPALGQQRATTGTVEVRVAVVVGGVDVRPVPLHELRLTPAGGVGDSLTLRSALDGSASAEVRAGAYRLASLRPVRVDGKAYSWDVPLEVAAGARTRLELTNANASVDSAQGAAPGRQIAPEMALYERLRRGVVKVQAGTAHGSGFVVDSAAGLVVTNDHVVDAAYGGEVSVFVDESTRVTAQVVASSHPVDLAVLRVHPAVTAPLPQLPIVRPDSSGAVAAGGERIVAIGFPLSQRSTVTTGIVSGVRGSAVLSDALIDHGNSGGPMLNLAGEVIAVNTFGTRSQPGGLGGAVSVVPLLPLLEQARAEAAARAAPSGDRLPVLPAAGYPIERIRGVADTARDRAYRNMEDTDFGNFAVTFTTPVSQFVAYKRFEDEIARDRRQREADAGLPEQERYNAFGPIRDWLEYVGDATAPVVTVTVTPRTGETSGSAWSRFLGTAIIGTPLQRARGEFKGDLQAVRFYRDGRLITPLLGGRTEQQAFVDNSWVTMRDIAYRGIYVLPYEAFRPDSAGVPPRLVVVITDLKHLDDAIVVEVFPATVARIWNDFLPYMDSAGSRPAAVRGNAYRSGVDLRHFCDTRNCWHGSREDSRLGGLRIQGTDDSAGVVVTYLREGSPLYAAGLRRWDRIVSVNGTPTLNWAAFERAVSEASDSLACTTARVGQTGERIVIRPARAAWER